MRAKYVNALELKPGDEILLDGCVYGITKITGTGPGKFAQLLLYFEADKLTGFEGQVRRVSSNIDAITSDGLDWKVIRLSENLLDNSFDKRYT